jgi:N-terminal acetyltransferase B complex catalytic subunit
MGKSEGTSRNWHGHVTVLTVAPAYRRLGVAKRLMERLESVSDNGAMWFVDLFVRESNTMAVKMYEGMGYSVYRKVLDYYSGPDEDALDMRKALKRDTLKQSIIPLPYPVHASDLDY